MPWIDDVASVCRVPPIWPTANVRGRRRCVAGVARGEPWRAGGAWPAGAGAWRAGGAARLCLPCAAGHAHGKGPCLPCAEGQAHGKHFFLFNLYFHSVCLLFN